MLHIAKLAVGIRNVAHLRAVQAHRSLEEPPLCHRTRNMPRRAAEISGGGSLYWVIGGIMQVRQRIVAIAADTWEDGSRCAALLLEPALAAVEPRPVKAFQGWRYLEADAAPADLSANRAAEEAEMPESLRRKLLALGLL